MNESKTINNEINSLEKAIKKSNFVEENAYLVNEEIYNEIKECSKNTNTRSYNKAKNKLKEKIKFINNIKSLENNENNISLRLISVKAIQTINIGENLKHYPIFYGNNKVIIEFSGQDEHDILLIEDPFNSNKNYKTFPMKIKNKKDQNEKLYKELIEKKINNYEDYIKKSKFNIIGEEKEKLKSKSLKDYIEINNCDDSLSDGNQPLKNQNDKTIGNLIIINNETRSNRNKKVYENNANRIPKNNQNSKYAINSARISPNKSKCLNTNYSSSKNKDKKEEEKENTKIIKLEKEINELKKDLHKKIVETKEQLKKEISDEISSKDNNLQKELNAAKNKIAQLEKENDTNKKTIENQQIIIKDYEKKFENLFNSINDLNNQIKELKQKNNESKIDKETIKEENKNENNNKNIIYGQEKQESNEIGCTMKNVNDYFYPNKINFNNNNNNNNNNYNNNYNNYNNNYNLIKSDFRNLNKIQNFRNDNEKISKFIQGGNSQISQCKIFQTPNPKEIIDKNDKKIHYLNIDKIKNNNNQYQLSNGFLAYLQDKNSKENNSSLILKIIENIDKNLQNNYNLKNIISTIFDQLHKELKKGVNKEIPPARNKEENDFQAFFKEFRKETSKITDSFTGFIEKEIQCNISINININKIYEFEKYNYLIIEKKHIKNKVANLSECLINYNGVRTFTEKKESKCKVCKNGMCCKTFYSYYYSNPQNLILILELENENSNEDIKVKFEEKLTLKSKLSEDNYNLYAVITQIGIDKQNIVASYKSNNDNNWYRYNNEGKKLIINIKKEVIDFGHPLALLYNKN